jgi:hypothetical protein
MDRHDGAKLASRFRSAVLIATAALVGVGCGGSSDNPASNSAAAAVRPAQSRSLSVSPESSRFIAVADRVCRRVNDELTAAPSQRELRGVASSARHNVHIERRAITELGKLTPPASLAGDWRQLIAYRARLAEELAKLGQSAQAGDAAGVRALAASKKLVHEQLSQLAARDGFKDCALVLAGDGLLNLLSPHGARGASAPQKL